MMRAGFGCTGSVAASPREAAPASAVAGARPSALPALAILAASTFAFLARPAEAQDLASSPCPRGNAGPLGTPDQQRAAQDACTQAYDVYQFVAPQLAISIVGGNAVLGQGSTLGGPLRFTVGVRANVISGSVPDVQAFPQTPQGAQRWSLPTDETVVGFPTADAAVGVFGGVPVGVGRVGGLDVLLSASFLPGLDVAGVTLTPRRHLQLGYGLRVGLLSDAGALPGVSFTWLKRDLPETDIVGRAGDVTLEVSSARIETSAWRLVAGKTFPVFALAAGVGQDEYDLRADVSASVRGVFSGEATVPGTAQVLTRTNYFVDASLRLGVFRLVGEIGRAAGGTIETYSAFAGGRADRPLTYAAAGIQFGR
jgi:hypothetical protein